MLVYVSVTLDYVCVYVCERTYVCEDTPIDEQIGTWLQSEQKLGTLILIDKVLLSTLGGVKWKFLGTEENGGTHEGIKWYCTRRNDTHKDSFEW